MDATRVLYCLIPDKIVCDNQEKNHKLVNKENKKIGVSVLLSVNADGEKMMPFIIFKGEANGRIYEKECKPYNK